MRRFVEAVRESGLVLGERPQYRQHNPHAQLHGREVKRLKAWEITEEDAIRDMEKKKNKK